MADARSLGDHGEAPDAVHDATAGWSDVRPPAALYAPEALARLRAALRAGLVPAAPPPPIRDDGAVEDAGLPAAAAIVFDSLPEHTDYRDEGCHVAPACLRCPLQRCIFDRPAHADAAVRRGRNRRMRTLARRGWPVAQLAHQFRLSPSHIRRILRASRSDLNQSHGDGPAPAPDG